MIFWIQALIVVTSTLLGLYLIVALPKILRVLLIFVVLIPFYFCKKLICQKRHFANLEAEWDKEHQAFLEANKVGDAHALVEALQLGETTLDKHYNEIASLVCEGNNINSIIESHSRYGCLYSKNEELFDIIGYGCDFTNLITFLHEVHSSLDDGLDSMPRFLLLDLYLLDYPLPD